MNSVLWLKLSEDTGLPERLTLEGQARLTAIFAPYDSPWTRALATLGLSWRGGPALRWVDGTAYVNGSALAETISAGWVQAERAPDGAVTYVSRARMARLPALLRSQWRIENYVAGLDGSPAVRVLPAGTPSTSTRDTAEHDAAIGESLVLGIALQALMLRLPRHTPAELAAWLAGSGRPPARVARVVKRLQQIQARRTQLSPAWIKLFAPHADASASAAEAPPWRWEQDGVLVSDTPPKILAAAVTHTASHPAGPWHGLPVHPGRRSGRAWLVDLHAPGPSPASPFIAVFAQARPGCVEHYGGAAAAVFGEGGVLSHACAVAREQALPAVTATGRACIAAIRAAGAEAWLTVDGATGEVILECRGEPAGAVHCDGVSQR